ncbi:MAG: hypothetical protein IJA35_02420 [Clostridia bacterium]|nr:hypothetical protein [Clostridia bacterium]
MDRCSIGINFGAAMSLILHDELRHLLTALFEVNLGIAVKNSDISFRSRHGELSVTVIRYGCEAGDLIPKIKPEFTEYLLGICPFEELNATIGHINFKLKYDFLDLLIGYISQKLPVPSLPTVLETSRDYAVAKLLTQSGCTGMGCPRVGCYRELFWEVYAACDPQLSRKQRINAIENASKHVLSFARKLNDEQKIMHYSVAGEFNAAILRLLLL